MTEENKKAFDIFCDNLISGANTILGQKRDREYDQTMSLHPNAMLITIMNSCLTLQSQILSFDFSGHPKETKSASSAIISSFDILLDHLVTILKERSGKNSNDHFSPKIIDCYESLLAFSDMLWKSVHDHIDTPKQDRDSVDSFLRDLFRNDL